MERINLKIQFRHKDNNIACLSVSGVNFTQIQNDINNDDAIKMFNALIGSKENSILEENKQLKEKLKYWVDIYTEVKKALEEMLSHCVEGSFSYRAYKTVLNKIEELENSKK